MPQRTMAEPRSDFIPNCMGRPHLHTYAFRQNVIVNKNCAIDVSGASKTTLVPTGTSLTSEWPEAE